MRAAIPSQEQLFTVQARAAKKYQSERGLAQGSAKKPQEGCLGANLESGELFSAA